MNFQETQSHLRREHEPLLDRNVDAIPAQFAQEGAVRAGLDLAGSGSIFEVLGPRAVVG